MERREDVGALVPELTLHWHEVGRFKREGPIAGKSTDCGPTDANSVVIQDVEGQPGADPKTAMANAHTAAKELGQASCEGGGCGGDGAKVCKYKEDKWTASVAKKDNAWVAKGTTSGHCQCE